MRTQICTELTRNHTDNDDPKPRLNGGVLCVDFFLSLRFLYVVRAQTVRFLETAQCTDVIHKENHTLFEKEQDRLTYMIDY
jgi:hypothetical protein